MHRPDAGRFGPRFGLRLPEFAENSPHSPMPSFLVEARKLHRPRAGARRGGHASARAPVRGGAMRCCGQRRSSGRPARSSAPPADPLPCPGSSSASSSPASPLGPRPAKADADVPGVLPNALPRDPRHRRAGGSRRGGRRARRRLRRVRTKLIAEVESGQKAELVACARHRPGNTPGTTRTALRPARVHTTSAPGRPRRLRAQLPPSRAAPTPAGAALV